MLTAILLHAASNATSSLLTNLFLEHNLSLDGLPISDRWLNVLAFGAMALILTLAMCGKLGYQAEGTE